MPPFASKHAGIPSDPLRNGMMAKMGTVEEIEQNRFVHRLLVPFCPLILLFSCAFYSLGSTRSLAHDSAYWPVERGFTIVGGITAIMFGLVLIFIIFMSKRLNDKVRNWVATLSLFISLLLIPTYFIELYFTVQSKNSAIALEQNQWFLAERTDRCPRRRSFENCNYYHQDVKLYDSNGGTFNASRYADLTKYYCVFGQRMRSAEGYLWFKVDRIEPIEYDTDFHGRLTKQGRIDLVNCTKQQSW